MRYLKLFVCGLFFMALGAEAQDSDGQAKQYEQWLQDNGYGGGSSQTNSARPPNNEVTPASNPTTTASTLPENKNPEGPHPPTLEESQQSMLDMVPKLKTPADPDSDKAFELLLQENLPLRPEQVVKLRQNMDIAQRVAAVPANVPPKPVSTTIMINLAPGSSPPAIRLSQGYVSSLVFVDSTGAPWPIAAYQVGNSRATNIQWDGKSNILLLQAVSAYSDSNMVIRLAKLPTPITLELVSGQRVVDFRVDIHVSGIGPNTKEIPKETSLPGSANQLLLNILDGVAPTGSKTLDVSGAEGEAWIWGGKMYLRTRFTVLSPGWIGKMTSSDGMQAYELPQSASILISRYGEPTELKVEGF